VESGGRDPGVSRPLCGRPLDMGKNVVSPLFVMPTFTAPLAVDHVCWCHLMAPEDAISFSFSSFFSSFFFVSEGGKS